MSRRVISRGMASETDTGRSTFELTPRGPDVGPNSPTRLARCHGEMVGAIIDDAVCTWLAQKDGQLVLLMWPRAFRARFDPLELLDEQGNVIAKGGEHVTVVGGFLAQDAPRLLGHQRIFAARPIRREPRTAR